MARRSKIVFCLLLAFLYVVVNICPLRAEALPEVMSGSTTLADNIMTYYALSGSAVANTDWINTLYSSYGSSFGTIEELANQGYLIMNDSGFWEPVQELGQMIEQAPAYSSLGLNEMFNVSAEEVAAGGGFAAASGGSILAGSLGGVASTGIVPLFGGVTASYWGGIALGTLINHLVDKYKQYVYSGASITTSQQIMQAHPDYRISSFKDLNGVKQYIFSPPNTMSAGLNNYSNRYVQWYLINPSNSNKIFYFTENNGRQNSSSVNANQIKTPNLGINYSFVGYILSNDQEAWDIARNAKPIPAVKSPDLIGENGNLETAPDENGEGYTIPAMKPQIDPGTQAGKPLTLQDWQNFANSVQNNNNNVSPTPGGNQGLFDDILDLIRTVIPENVPNPNPNPNPDPWSPPVVTPVPDPAYPDPVPDQQITENPQESENPQQTENPIDTGKPWRLPDLRQKFPFCIPWDIAKVFSKLKVNARQAPHISWRFNPPNTPIDYTFNLDLEDFEEVATLLRTLELLGFIVGLAFATRYLIGAN